MPKEEKRQLKGTKGKPKVLKKKQVFLMLSLRPSLSSRLLRNFVRKHSRLKEVAQSVKIAISVEKVSFEQLTTAFLDSASILSPMRHSKSFQNTPTFIFTAPPSISLEIAHFAVLRAPQRFNASFPYEIASFRFESVLEAILRVLQHLQASSVAFRRVSATLRHPCTQFNLDPALFRVSCSFRGKTLRSIGEHRFDSNSVDCADLQVVFLSFSHYFVLLSRFSAFSSKPSVFLHSFDVNLVLYAIYDVLDRYARNSPRKDAFLRHLPSQPISYHFAVLRTLSIAKSLSKVVPYDLEALLPISPHFRSPEPYDFDFRPLKALFATLRHSFRLPLHFSHSRTRFRIRTPPYCRNDDTILFARCELDFPFFLLSSLLFTSFLSFFFHIFTISASPPYLILRNQIMQRH